MLFITLLAGILLTLAIWIAPYSLLQRLSGMSHDHLGWLALVPGMLMLMACQLILQAWLTREKRFGVINLGALAQVLVAAVVTIGGGWLYQPSALIAVLGGLAGQAAAVALLAISTRSVLLLDLAHLPRLDHVAKAMSDFRVYPKYMLPYSISVGLTERVILVAISTMFSVSFLGAFYAARQFIQGPAQIISASFRNVLLGHGARHESLTQIRPYVRAMLTAYVFTISPLLAFGVEWTEDVIAWTLGTRWPKIETLAWWCIFPSAIMLLTGSMDRLFDLAGRQRLATIMQIASDAAMLVTLFFAWHMGASGTAVVGVLSIVQTTYNLLWLAVILHIIGLGWALIFGRGAIFIGIFLVSWGLQWLLREQLEATFSFGCGLLVALATSGFGAYMTVRQRRFTLP
jgi:O-antigen/teichoic acid export membrane protein